MSAPDELPEPDREMIDAVIDAHYEKHGSAVKGDLYGQIAGTVRSARTACQHSWEPMCERARTGEIVDCWEQCLHCGAQQ